MVSFLHVSSENRFYGILFLGTHGSCFEYFRVSHFIQSALLFSVVTIAACNDYYLLEEVFEN